MKTTAIKPRINRSALRVLAGAALGIACLPVGAQVSLASVVDLSQRNSVAVRMAQADLLKAQAALSQSKDVFIPSMLFGTGIPAFPEEGFTGSPPTLWSTTVQSLVFSVPQNHYIHAARAGLDAATAALKDAKEQTALDASTAYIELDTVNRELKEAADQEALAGHLVDIEQQRTEAGVDPLNDLLEARLTAANIKLRRMHLETRAGTLAEQLAGLTGLSASVIVPDHASIPEIPQIHASDAKLEVLGIDSAKLVAKSKLEAAKGDNAFNYFPQLSFFAQYNRNTTVLNDINSFFARPLPANNISSGFSIQIPLFDMEHRAKARGSSADALRATVEAEQAQKQNDLQIVQLNGSIRELETLAEIASLKQQIAGEQLKTVQTELDLGNGSGSAPGSTPQATPKTEQLARIEGTQRLQEADEAGFDLAKARLGLLRALGHMQDWLKELNGK
ncbi:MAG TPA: TolC family protein [Terracidiphilus sp.]|nr:TolC family protein [Terracidiphilus sp.]